jgi:hypothetical protein
MGLMFLYTIILLRVRTLTSQASSLAEGLCVRGGGVLIITLYDNKWLQS